MGFFTPPFVMGAGKTLLTVVRVPTKVLFSMNGSDGAGPVGEDAGAFVLSASVLLGASPIGGAGAGWPRHLGGLPPRQLLRLWAAILILFMPFSGR